MNVILTSTIPAGKKIKFDLHTIRKKKKLGTTLLKKPNRDTLICAASSKIDTYEAFSTSHS